MPKIFTSETQKTGEIGEKIAEKFLVKRGFKILDALDEVAAKHQVEQASVALAWLIYHPSVTAPIASVTDLKQLKSFAEAANLKLTPEDISLLDKASIY